MNKMLQIVLRLNSLSCLGFGISFALAPDAIGNFLGGVIPLVLRWVGIALLLNGIHLAVASFREKIGRNELAYFISGDFIWVVGSLALILFVPGVIDGRIAIATTFLVAVLVGSFAFLQIRFGIEILKSA